MGCLVGCAEDDTGSLSDSELVQERAALLSDDPFAGEPHESLAPPPQNPYEPSQEALSADECDLTRRPGYAEPAASGFSTPLRFADSALDADLASTAAKAWNAQGSYVERSDAERLEYDTLWRRDPTVQSDASQVVTARPETLAAQAAYQAYLEQHPATTPAERAARKDELFDGVVSQEVVP